VKWKVEREWKRIDCNQGEIERSGEGFAKSTPKANM
jgi:hypothetical protein